MLVITDHFTRWVEAYPLRDEKASTIADVLVNEFISRFGVMKRVHSDQGRNFVGAVMKAVCELLDIQQSQTSSYHPMGNAVTERANRTILNNEHAGQVCGVSLRVGQAPSDANAGLS